MLNQLTNSHFISLNEKIVNLKYLDNYDKFHYDYAHSLKESLDLLFGDLNYDDYPEIANNMEINIINYSRIFISYFNLRKLFHQPR